ncbi:nickel/cobalt transporter [Kaistia geumhonensis]|uniref:Nickel/cobalt efflux system n=1 Tax=Kaistia geumhonensis TaxID=410839 RepID=A0ABU0M934_9HYPH|nr:nickel/cobalt transporter [Kaistia geumhonensis]MCX5480817.1 nickel/cobalt transporter [Kaistia geumhonensis]MDQ0517479.1 nickel/cobalt exporter [Kaistia geumhonensis]
MRRLALALAALLAPALVQAAPSPFGIATPDGGGTVAWAGPLRGFFVWIAAEQSSFYRALTAALSAFADNPHAAFILIGLSLAYGVFHAVGPGHGKAVIASYLLATGDTLKRGIAISFASAFVQALTAIVVVTIGAVVLNVTAVTMTRATDALEIASFALIAICGVWLLWSKTLGRHGDEAGPAPHVHDASCAINHGRLGLSGTNLSGNLGSGLGRNLGGAPRLAFSATPVSASSASAAAVSSFACDCAHGHAPDPSTLTAPLTLRSAWTAILAVGIRPCSGAVIVLVFALSQKLWWVGILSVLAMALGTGVTVAVLAAIAVKAKDIALRVSNRGESPIALRVMRGVEIAAAAGILLFGLAMLGGALAGL